MKLIHNKTFLFALLTIAAIFIVVAAGIAIKIVHDKSVTSKTVVSVPKEMTEKEIEPIEVPDDDSFLDQSNIEEEAADPADEVKPVEKKNAKTGEKVVASNGMPYFVRVNYVANVVTVYSKDSDGNYTIPIKAMICSTGRATPRSGTYKTSVKWRWAALFGGVYGQYATRITGSILFHSVPYTRNYDPNSLEWWEYDKLGTACSAGCVRLTVADAIWVYNNLGSGTMVEFYGDSNPGPLGKPGARKISGNEQCRGWDPTDPDGNNPWRGVPAPSPSVEPSVEPSVTTSASATASTTANTSPIASEQPSVEPDTEPSELPSEEPSTSPIVTPSETTTPSISSDNDTSESSGSSQAAPNLDFAF